MGAITDIVRRNLPSSYRAMIGASGYTDYYGITELQDIADFVQYRLFSTVAGASNEATVWNLKQRELLGDLTSLQFIPAAIEYWNDQLISEHTTGTNETITYPTKGPDLWKIFAQLQLEAQQLAVDIGIPLNQVKANTPSISYGDNGRHILKTTDPYRFPRLGGSRQNIRLGTEIDWTP